jgi:hypothetical protein
MLITWWRQMAGSRVALLIPLAAVIDENGREVWLFLQSL